MSACAGPRRKSSGNSNKSLQHFDVEMDTPPHGLPEGHSFCLSSNKEEKKSFSFFIKKDVTSSNKCLCELLKATTGEDFSNSCIHEILA